MMKLFGLMSGARRRQFYGVSVLMIAGAIAEMSTIGSVLPFLAELAGDRQQVAAPILDRLAAATGGNHLIGYASLFIAVSVVAACLRLLLSWSTQKFALGFGHDLAVEIQHRVIHQPYSYHVGQNSSRLLASLEKGQILTSGVLLQVMQAASALVMGLFITAALFLVDARAAGIAAVSFGLSYYIVSRLASPTLALNSEMLGSAYDRRIQIIQETLGGIRDVILDQSQAAHLEKFRDIDDRFMRARLSSGFLSAAPRFIIEATAMVVIAILAVILSRGGEGFAAALPVLGALALGGLRLIPLLQQLYQAWSGIAANRSIADDVIMLLELPLPEEHDASPLPFTRSIRMAGVSFQYPERSHSALDNIDLEIIRNSRTALVGRTGSGKTTLADLLMGLIEPNAGTILVDAIPLTGATRQSWQRDIAHVPQSIFLSDDSIARNIAVSKSAQGIDMDRVREAARIADLDDFIASLPHGLDTRVGERGVRLSGGQRQRLGIARAVYKNAPILILDEATNALDSETELAVMHALDELQKLGRTIIVISHRQTSLRGCDRVVHLDHGRIVSIEEVQ